jgi:hypothetical protein
LEEKRRPERDIEIFKMVEEHFKQDIREFWTRANFYLLAHAGLFSAFIMAYPALLKSQIMILVILSMLGLVTSIFWFFVLRGSIKWLQRWREQVIDLDEKLDSFKCYVKVESFAKERPFLSPSYITQFFPLVFATAWLAVLLVTVLPLIFDY